MSILRLDSLPMLPADQLLDLAGHQQDNHQARHLLDRDLVALANAPDQLLAQRPNPAFELNTYLGGIQAVHTPVSTHFVDVMTPVPAVMSPGPDHPPQNLQLQLQQHNTDNASTSPFTPLPYRNLQLTAFHAVHEHTYTAGASNSPKQTPAVTTGPSPSTFITGNKKKNINSSDSSVFAPAQFEDKAQYKVVGAQTSRGKKQPTPCKTLGEDPDDVLPPSQPR